MSEVDWDFVSLMHPDVAGKILSCLDDPADILHACSVSRAWRDFVIANGICKRLCLRLFPDLDGLACLQQKTTGLGFSRVTELEHLKKEHKLFANSLAGMLQLFEMGKYPLDSIHALITDLYPKKQTFHIIDRSEGLNSMETYYLFCKSIPQVPEILLFTSDFGDVQVDSLEGFFQGSSACKPSAKALRFYEGYSCFIRKATCIWKIVESEDQCSCVIMIKFYRTRLTFS